jgi:hypothetical protein
MRIDASIKEREIYIEKRRTFFFRILLLGGDEKKIAVNGCEKKARIVGSSQLIANVPLC